MHDPKLTAAVAQHQLQISESALDKLSGGQYVHYHNYTAATDPLENPHHRLSKAMALPRGIFPQLPAPATYAEDLFDIRGGRHFGPLPHLMKDVGSISDSMPYAGHSSVFSELAAQYRYSDLLHAQRLYESFHGDLTSTSLPLSIATLSRRLASNHRDYLFPNHALTAPSSSGVVIKDVTLVPTSSTSSSSSSSSSPSSLTRVANALSLSPLHVSTTNAPSSPPLSSQSSPSPHRRSSVSPDTRWSELQSQQQRGARPGFYSSLSVPRDVTLYDDRAAQQGERSLPPSLIRSPMSLSTPAWPLPTSVAMYGPSVPPLIRVYGPTLSAQYDSRVGSGHLQDQYLSSPLGFSHRHLHHHLHRHHHIRDSLYNANTPNPCPDARSSPGKELPTKAFKQDRVRDRQELSGVLDADREHSERLCNVKKSASTQTQFSSFSCENLPPPPYYTTHDTIPHDKLHTSTAPSHAYSHHLPPPPPPPPPALLQYPHSTSIHHSSLGPPSLHPTTVPTSLTTHSASLLTHPASHAPANRHLYTHTSPSPPTAATPTLPPPPLMRSSPPAPQSLPPYSNSPRSCSPPPPPQYTELTRVHVDVQHVPLNLSLSSAPPIPPTTPPTRPSVITSANTSPPRGSSESYRPDVEHQDSSSYRTVTLKNGSSHETAAQVSDEAIEEHFRRSLGKCYGEQPSPSKKPAVHVSEKICSVDDHFARALGDQMWTEIKARTEPPPLDALSGTVDAHFAKALGATMWKKLKAENKLVDDVGSAQEQQPPQQSQTHHQEQQQQQQQPQLQASSHNRKSPSASPLQTSLVT